MCHECFFFGKNWPVFYWLLCLQRLHYASFFVNVVRFFLACPCSFLQSKMNGTERRFTVFVGADCSSVLIDRSFLSSETVVKPVHVKGTAVCNNYCHRYRNSHAVWYMPRVRMVWVLGPASQESRVQLPSVPFQVKLLASWSHVCLLLRSLNNRAVMPCAWEGNL